ncbi:hypothetical protein ASPVEDRAFT_154023 [Aspergillus versicolor CBS 583.65]|uniref:Zn(2)-C6 fungal-type domain-containing protein n=1 Tax=Aspergillus versicolor CBS 583.65 TaxID=1036611 RepID=A0A1L9PWI4_ASPVE|nr:uncharacterized protein ASPVEDRAFT_154023 [Aspergillus versicolor CBS 583.65]OJJ05894.1 hypothetical protein ASPVEDRAFT_154023 [Aspergillus versicolor CBS 583.65]
MPRYQLLFDMPPHNSYSNTLPPGRTGHACVQCRHRKQKCGGFTYDVKCQPCTNRNVECSFQEEVKELRLNPYLRLRSSRSPSANFDDPRIENTRVSAASSSSFLVSDPTALASGAVQLDARHASPAEEALPKKVDSLQSRVAELEQRLGIAHGGIADYVDTAPRSQARTSLLHHAKPDQTQQSYDSPSSVPVGLLCNSNPQSLPSPHGTVNTDGPLKALNSMQREDPGALEINDPITRSVLTEGEAHVIFRLYFSNCHLNVPLLDVNVDAEIDRVRSRSALLFIAILSVGARFWSASSKSSCWLHPRYTDLVRLLDAEIMRVTLRPRHEDQRLETVQALMLCAHWMPFDLAPGPQRYQSRFSEAGAWQCLGLAIRWATSLTLERSCHTSFLHPETVTQEDARRFRTMLYLVESDHYLALSARRPSYLNPKPLYDVLTNFLGCKYVQATDTRLTSLFRVAYSTHFTECRPTTIESVEAFDHDVQLIERRFMARQGDQSMDRFSQHFPFTSLQWYRLSYACAFLDATDPSQRTGKVLTWAVEWASQILVHLSKPLSAIRSPLQVQLEPDPSVVDMMSFAIDHYYVVIAYAAFFLVNSWLVSLIDINLRPHSSPQPNEIPVSGNIDPSASLLFRLVDVAARTLEAASPPEGHLARRYSTLLRGMAGLILSGNTQAQTNNPSSSNDSSAIFMDANNFAPEQLQNHLGEDLWEMWQQAGLEPMIWSNLLDTI